MPRRSSADLSVIRLPGKGRPEPSPKLSQAEQRDWRAIVDSTPDRWLDPAGQLIFQRLVTQIGVTERHEQRLRQIAEAGGPLEAELEVARAHRDASKAVVAMMTALRATPRARTRPRGAESAFARAPSGQRPWDIEAQATVTGASETEDGDAPA
jgi:hypothetical protein